jgi:hypothetical protein
LAEIFEERIRGAGAIDLDGVIDDEIDGDERFDDGAVFTETGDCFAHCGEVDQERNAGEVLENDASDDERNFGVDGFSGVPVGERADVVFGDGDAIAITQDGFEDQSDGDWEAGNFSEACLFECGEGIEGARLASGGERSESFEGIVVGHDELQHIAESKEGGRGKPDRLQSRRLF